ncbi:MAG: restriction endonuclease subunit S [Lactococcus lactis]|nr:restriction endonuclease subunit S [Lactococcus lactis]
MPKIRFPEFTDAWEQYKLEDLLIPSDEKNNSRNYIQDDILAASLGTELVKKHIFFGLRSTEESIKNYRVVNFGDVIYTKSPIKGYPNGIIRTNKGISGIVPSLYCVYRSVPFINPSIIQSYFEDKFRLDSYLYPLVNVGARNNVNITDLGFLEGFITIPREIEEQNKIVNFLDEVSNLITIHQHKLSNVKELKMGLLQKMFPKKGEDKPEVRFPEFTDAWEQCKLFDNINDVLDYRGKSPTKFGMEWGSEGYLVLSALNVKDGYIDKSVEAKYGSQKLFERWMGDRRLNKGDVVFTTEAPLGNVAQVPDDNGYILNQRAVAFKTDGVKTDNNFLAQLLRSPLFKNKLQANASGGTAKGIGMREFAKMTAFFPKDINEQIKIGAFFTNLDHLIILHQRKLDHLQEQKKALLQQMFI